MRGAFSFLPGVEPRKLRDVIRGLEFRTTKLMLRIAGSRQVGPVPSDATDSSAYTRQRAVREDRDDSLPLFWLFGRLDRTQGRQGGVRCSP